VVQDDACFFSLCWERHVTRAVERDVARSQHGSFRPASHAHQMPWSVRTRRGVVLSSGERSLTVSGLS
jgi:hypothetical protein